MKKISTRTPLLFADLARKRSGVAAPEHDQAAEAVDHAPPLVATSSRAATWLMLNLCVALGAFLRVWQLNSLGYNSDEAVYAGQAAAIAGDPTLREIFPIFRAHPLLFQFLLSLGFKFGVNDLVGRLLAVATGLATIYVVYLLGRQLYGQRAGLIAALFMAVMPYHVVVTRQVLLDGPMTLCATLTLYMMVRFAASEDRAWLYAVGAAMGLTFLAKETGVILLSAIYAFFATTPEVRVRIRDLIGSTVVMVLVILPFPLSLMLAGGGGQRSGQSYLVWQLFRRPNHEWPFYATTVPAAVGPLVIVAALVGLWLLRRERSWREKLLIWWILVPVVFFQLWPTKGFQYLLPAAPAVALLAGRVLARLPWAADGRRWALRRWLQPLVVGGIALTLLVPSWQQVQAVISDQFLAGSGGIPGGRDAGLWIRDNVPSGAKLITIGPSMANILQFYGHRQAFGLSVSPNPLRRNPSYTAIRNPDLQLRTGEMQYLVWDSFSASRSAHFGDRISELAQRYNGRVIHTETVPVVTPEGATAVKPVIIIYEVRP